MTAPRSISTAGILLTVLAFVASWQGVGAQSARAAVDPGFEQMLDRVDAAQLDLQNGRAEPFKALWSRADDVTLSGGLGGDIERGWTNVASRLDWVATQFSAATHQRERVTVNVSGNLGYVVQREHIRFHEPGHAAESRRDYRVTMIFRKEAAGWRIVHRQADSQVTKPGAR